MKAEKKFTFDPIKKMTNIVYSVGQCSQIQVSFHSGPKLIIGDWSQSSINNLWMPE